MMGKTNIGTQLKIALNLQCADLEMEEYDFTARFFTYANRYVDVKKSDMVVSDGTYIAIVDTSQLSGGEIQVRVEADIPDADVGGTRKEIATARTGIFLGR